MIPTRRIRSAAWTLPVLLSIAAACSSSPSETADGATDALRMRTTKSWVDGNVLSFKLTPAAPDLVYVLGTDGNLWREVGSMTDRTQVDGNVRDYQPLDGSVVYVLGTDGNLWREVDSMATRTPVASGVGKFQVTTGGAEKVYFLDGEGTLWLVAPGQEPRSLTANVTDFEWTPGLEGAALYVLHADGTLVRDASDFVFLPWPVDANVASFETIDSMSVLVRGTDSNLWSEEGDYTARTLVDSNVAASFSSLDGVTVFVQDERFDLWREELSSHNRDLIGHDVQSHAAVGRDLVYVLDRDANLWRQTLAAPACIYSFPLPPAAGQYVDAWGVTTKSGRCPNVPAATGTWSNMVGGYIPGVPTGLYAPPTPKCADNGLPANCCIYVWSPSPGTLAPQDASVLCSRDVRQMVAFEAGSIPCPVNQVCTPGGGGCSSCIHH